MKGQLEWVTSFDVLSLLYLSEFDQRGRFRAKTLILGTEGLVPTQGQREC